MPVNGDQGLSFYTRVPQFFITFVGVIYATGFFALYTFFSHFGLKGTGIEFFKVKYLHIGFIYLLLVAITITPIVTMLYLRKLDKDSNGEGSKNVTKHSKGKDVSRFSFASTIVVFNMLLSFYIFAFFAPYKFIVERTLSIPKYCWISMVFLFTIFGLIIIRRSREYIIETYSAKFVNAARWFLCAFIIIMLDIPLLYGLFDHLWEMIINGGLYFIFIMFLISYISWRLLFIKGNYEKEKRPAVYILAACVLLAFYYISVFTFGLRIYSYMPASKGGGDYSSVPNIIVGFQGSMYSLPKEIINPCYKNLNTSHYSLCSIEMKLIEESSTSIFLAIPEDAGGPTKWREIRGGKPRIYEIRRENIASIVYLNKVDKNEK